ncbi:hypothetical protein [Spirosoma pollinicola]|uniref:Lipocalin-like domain-containing protein n=1 Tax=Spirosoma pollinicola TaxID=2057025 RepID=A0A2K8YU70_9BACT|nr:hypothetical protein [Spirosoma pollinicola]AUD01180.1 hypothetical protein CWM47_04725 [Spirosoma pollinicola]
MQRSAFFTLLTTIIFGSCQKDKLIGPSDLLYNRWHLTQTRTLDSHVWQSRDTDAYYTIEYRQDGTVAYQRNGVTTPANCCAPTKFNRQGIVVNYTDWVICPTAFCATTKKTIITQLTDDLLELNDGYTISQYEVAK